MKANALIRIACVGLMTVGALSACSSSNDGSEELIGKASLAVTAVPTDVGCIRITVSGVRTVVDSFSVSSGQSSNFSLTGLPLGNDTFSGEGFGGACPPAAGAVANWIGGPVAASVAVAPPVNVTIKMVRNGKSNVGIDFQDDTASCSDMLKDGNETDVDCGGGTCAPCTSGKLCTANSDCTAGVCLNNVCGGCQTNADCPTGLICDVTTRQCVGGCAAPFATCGGACVDVTSDPNNCGMCGNICPMGVTCVAGACSACAAGQVRCGNVCTAVQSDPNNCGACGRVCPTGLACIMGACVLSPATCTDGIRDNGESGVDCGGSTPCPRCQVMQTCQVASDCISTHCTAGICTP